MSTYFKLQFKIICRSVQGIGIPWILIFPAILIFYASLFYILKLSPYWSAYLIFLITFQSLFSLSEFNRNDFLKTTFNTIDYHKIRLLENLIISFGAILLLLINRNFELAIMLISSGILFVFVSTNSFWSMPIATPFTKKPFEFIIGFRKTWLLLLMLYALAGIGLVYNNQNLALFCMFCICICTIQYYQNIEPFYILWNQNRSAISFLWHKIGRGIVQLSMLLLPIMLAQTIIYPDELYKVIMIWGLGILLIPFVISLKYACYPRKISVSEGVILGMCLVFYPLILAIIPYYYHKAIKNLKTLL